MEIESYFAWMIGAVPVFLCVLWWWNDFWYNYVLESRCVSSETKLPRGHMGLPFFGETFSFLWFFMVLRKPDDYINSKRQRYSDGVGLYRTHLFKSPAIIACSPSVNKFILQSNEDFILDWAKVEIVGKKSLLSVQGVAYTRLKTLILRALNQPETLRRITLMVQPRVADALESWAEKGKIVACVETKKVTFENMGKIFASFEPGPILNTLDSLSAAIIKNIRGYPINIPGTACYRAIQSRKKLEAIFRNELEKRKIDFAYQNNKDDLMAELINSKDEEGKYLTESEVVDNIITLVIAGYESTALSITWAVYLLAKYPNVLLKLREENMALSKGKNGKLITHEDVLKLKYTNKVVKETIRMANLAPMCIRTATKDVNYKGYKIPKGWKVMVWVRYLHTNPENFDDPMCFNPDRWNVPTNPGAYQVFGMGPHKCAGDTLARLQVAILLHYLAIGYKWELVNPDAKINHLPTPRPADGVEIAFSKLH